MRDKQKGMRIKSNKGSMRRKPGSEGNASKKVGNGDGIYGKKEGSGGAESKERMGCGCGNQSGTGIEYRDQRDAGDAVRNLENTVYGYGGRYPENKGYSNWKNEQEEAEYGSHGNIFSIDDEEEQESNGKHVSRSIPVPLRHLY